MHTKVYHDDFKFQEFQNLKKIRKTTFFVISLKLKVLSNLYLDLKTTLVYKNEFRTFSCLNSGIGIF